MKNSLNKTARWSTLALALGIMSTISVQGLAAINWPGGGGNDTTKKSKDYKKGYKIGQEDCVKAPKDCKVLLEDVIANPGWGETEPNDHPSAADRIFLNRFYKGNTLDKFDQDWYYLAATSPNQNLMINFLGDQNNYTDTAGWLVKVHDRFGNVIATFDTTTTGTGNVYRNGDNPEDTVDPGEPLLAKTPLSDAHIMLTTLSFPGRYYISVESLEDTGDGRAYHIAAMISPSDQMSPNPDSNFQDAETEPNDLQEQADPLDSNVHIFGTFGRKWVRWFVPPEDNVDWLWPGCDPADISSLPLGQDNCNCDHTVPGNICVAQPRNDGQGTWEYAYDYDNDWFRYHSDGNEQLHFEMCTKGNCDFTRVHVRIIYVNNSVVLLDGPILPGVSFDLGAASPGTYFIELSPEPVDGPKVDPESGVHTVDDLTGPYNFMLRSTKLPAHGG
ncbi:hypothetical protein [Thiolapillus brandeum]|uniref:Uncharacterized protein n=1 Tax=Thiolapillus brandeum TaxID=1076588 RepID=A0A7U6GL17_9GAMM|nr:hypothetical protein [Thiolapillus brandeum]BAO45601.1 hypothetical protein TBH_C2696 [Thiolapillus brandeum]